ncbi:MAG: GNAT family N-acetyltransferase [Chloroflexi bacterium]|nr:GNAT family N-acetyltransferase [Chloroflexota bacterium]
MSLRDVRLVTAAMVTWDVLVQALNRGYSDYFETVHTTVRQLQRMTAAWDVDLEGSAVALSGDGEPIGVGLLGLRGGRAWIGGLAVVPEWRRQGLGRALLDRLIAAAHERRARHITLEVLCENEPAIALYRSAGFYVRRELLSWERSPEVGTLPVPAARAAPVEAASLIADFDAWHAQPPCWQRELRSLRPFLRRLDGWALMEAGRPVAYALTLGQADQLTLVDIGISPEINVRSAARPLLQSLQLLHMDSVLILHNQPAGDPLNHVLAALGFRVDRRQYEMRLALVEGDP